MSTPTFDRYRIEGLDCAQCANEIETALRRIDGFDGASVSFATESIVIPSGRRDQAQEVVDRVEPGARIIDGDKRRSGLGHDERRANALRIARISAAIVLTGVGIGFSRALHEIEYHFVEYLIFGAAYLLVGWPVLSGAVRNIVRGRVFDELFLMSVATLGAFAIHELAEAVAVMLFYSVGEYVQDLAVGRSRRSISSLMNLRPETARFIAAEGVRIVDPESVEVGALIEVLPGERVPLDGDVVEGESYVDTSALTGESVPRSVGAGDEVLSGYVNDSGRIRIRVRRAFGESSVARILELVENAASKKSPTETFISRFAAIYTPIIVGIALAVAFVPPLVVANATFSEWIYRALVVLVISCPCALVISVPLGYFGGIGGASRNGILIKGANYVDALKDVSTVVLDKTGTLTQGTFRVTDIVARNGYHASDVLRIAATAEAHSTHPIARSIRGAYASDAGSDVADREADRLPVDADAVSEVREEKGFGIRAVASGHVILAGSDRLLHREGIDHTDCDVEGTIVYVAFDDEYVGYIVISDELKPEAPHAVRELRRLGVDRVVMLTGDNGTIARGVARDTGIDEYHASLLPEEKVARVEALADELPAGKRLAFVGDGINDAPVLMRADVGFAMGGLGSDAAIEAADIVVMDDRIDSVPRALSIASFTRRVVLENIVFALTVKGAFLALGAVGIATMWEAVVADMGVSLLAVLNATRTLRRRGSD